MHPPKNIYITLANNLVTTVEGMTRLSFHAYSRNAVLVILILVGS